jgi:hypothetical protein
MINILNALGHLVKPSQIKFENFAVANVPVKKFKKNAFEKIWGGGLFSSLKLQSNGWYHLIVILENGW